MPVSADDVRRLLASQDPDAALVLIEGRVAVVTPAELDGPDYRGALQIMRREDLLRQAGGARLSGDELAQQAEDVNTAVRNLGG